MDRPTVAPAQAVGVVQPDAARPLPTSSPGSFARVAGAIGAAGAILGAIDLVRVDDGPSCAT